MNEREHESQSLEQQLERLLADAETTVASLRHELNEARVRRVREDEINAQREEIGRLAEHFAEAQVHWGAVREFFEAALQELHLSGDDERNDDSRDDDGSDEYPEGAH